MTLSDAIKMLNYCGSIRNLEYKHIEMCINSKWGYGIRVFDNHSEEIIEQYRCTRDTMKALREEIRTDFDRLYNVNGHIYYKAD